LSRSLGICGSLAWLPGAVRDLHERSGFPQLGGDHRRHPGFPPHPTPHCCGLREGEAAVWGAAS